MPHLALDDVSLYYEEHGEGDAVLLLAELGGSVRSWRHVVGPLSSGFRLIAVDIRGTGLSEKPLSGYSIPGIARDLVQFIRRKGLSSLHVVACGTGTVVAMELALQAPEMVRSLVLCSVAPNISEETKAYVLQRAELVRRSGMRAAVGTSALNSFPDGIALPAEIAREEYECNFLANDPNAYASISEALTRWSGDARLRAIDCPCLCIAGDLDFIWGEDSVRATAEAIPGAEFTMLEQAGHFPPLSAPAGFIAEVDRFLKAQN